MTILNSVHLNLNPLNFGLYPIVFSLGKGPIKIWLHFLFYFYTLTISLLEIVKQISRCSVIHLPGLCGNPPPLAQVKVFFLWLPFFLFLYTTSERKCLGLDFLGHTKEYPVWRNLLSELWVWSFRWGVASCQIWLGCLTWSHCQLSQPERNFFLKELLNILLQPECF